MKKKFKGYEEDPGLISIGKYGTKHYKSSLHTVLQESEVEIFDEIYMLNYLSPELFNLILSDRN